MVRCVSRFSRSLALASHLTRMRPSPAPALCPPPACLRLPPPLAAAFPMQSGSYEEQTGGQSKKRKTKRAPRSDEFEEPAPGEAPSRYGFCVCGVCVSLYTSYLLVMHSLLSTFSLTPRSESTPPPPPPPTPSIHLGEGGWDGLCLRFGGRRCGHRHELR